MAESTRGKRVGEVREELKSTRNPPQIHRVYFTEYFSIWGRMNGQVFLNFAHKIGAIENDSTNLVVQDFLWLLLITNWTLLFKITSQRILLSQLSKGNEGKTMLVLT